jgi:Flp pilus assembly protein TadG
MNKFFGKSRGQIAVVYAVAIAGLLAAAALGTDVAVMYMDWQHAQKVADAAALAGANYLGGGITYTGTVTSGCAGEGADSASEAACTYAVNNGLPAGTVTISEPDSSHITVVATQSDLPYFFGSVFGSRNYAVSASATAVAAGAPNTVLGSTSNTTDQGLFPIGLQCAKPCGAGSLVAGEPIAFGTKFISTTVNAPGNWDWIGPDGKGASAIGGDIANGVQGAFAVSPDGSCGTNSVGASYCINSATGNKTNSGPMQTALAARLASCPNIADPCANGGNPNDIPAGDPCLVIMPMVDFTGVSGSKPMPIEQFAEVYLEPDSTPTSLDGCFISTVAGNTLAVTTTTTTTTTVSTGIITPPTLSN